MLGQYVYLLLGSGRVSGLGRRVCGFRFEGSTVFKGFWLPVEGLKGLGFRAYG